MTYCHQPSHFSHRLTLGRLIVRASMSPLKENTSGEASHCTCYTCNFPCIRFYGVGRALMSRKQHFQFPEFSNSCIHALTYLARCTINGYRARAQHCLYWMWPVGTRDDFPKKFQLLLEPAPGSLYRAGLNYRECFHWPAAKEVLMGII